MSNSFHGHLELIDWWKKGRIKFNLFFSLIAIPLFLILAYEETQYTERDPMDIYPSSPPPTLGESFVIYLIIYIILMLIVNIGYAILQWYAINRKVKTSKIIYHVYTCFWYLLFAYLGIPTLIHFIGNSSFFDF